MEIKYHQLLNGIRLVHLPVISGLVGHCGLLINAGSRDEKPGKEGIAHFIEHLLFKGTTKRKAFHIVSRIDEIGGELNAFTTKENTFIYASFPGNNLDRALEIIADITFYSTFPAKEMEKERAVIIDEILSYKDDPSEEISDDFDDIIFPDHPLGSNILGTKENVSKFKIEEIKEFIKENYHTDEMVIGYVGPESNHQFVKKAEKYFGEIPASSKSTVRKAPSSYTAKNITKSKETYSCHAMIGNRAFGTKDEKRLPFFLLNNILGGPGLNSRLNLNIREKYGFTYYLESSYAPLEDSGIWYVYLATEKGNLNKTITLVQKELQKLREIKLGSMQLDKAKTQLKGQLAMSNESNSSLLHVIVRSILVFREVESIEDIYRQIDKVTAEDLMELANEIFDPSKLSQLVYLSR